MKTYITKIDEKYYAFAGDTNKNQVYSIGADKPSDGSAWFATWNDNGIKYVSSPSPSRNAAYKKAKRASNEYVEYGGEV